MQDGVKLPQPSSREEETAVLSDPDEDATYGYCSATNRIVMISPLPGRFHELVKELTSACYDVLVFHHADAGLLTQLKADLLILDHTLPEEHMPSLPVLDSPLELLRVPVLHMVKSGSDSQGLLTLEWPTPVAEAVASISSIMDEVGAAASSPVAEDASSEGVLQLKDLTVDLRRYVVQSGERRIDLTRTEFDLLRTIIEVGGLALSRQELMDRVWGADHLGGSNTIDAHVKSLRHKLCDDPRNPRYIVTVRGIGYRAADS